MGLPSKEDQVLELFFNESSKHWHFEEIVKKSRLSRDKVNKWLKKFMDEGIIMKVEETGKLPYYISNFSQPSYKNRKKLYALNLFYRKGLLNHLTALDKAQTVILFGSFSRADWNTESDIDIFIYGKDDEFEQGKYQKLLKREIQTFTCKDKKELSKFREGVLKNILNGYIVKGNLDFVTNNLNKFGGKDA
ncbi:nucleotidyltransferase domain-containing protein [Candidatus Woesearchaeota archaeon]|nr:nucleotidyltransferase domain-containing protein [Candidatus Woesearchaeota archaeon]